MNGNKIDSINENDFDKDDFKYRYCKNIVDELGIDYQNIYGIGDSAVDIKMLSLDAHKFAVNPKGGLENNIDIVIDNDLSEIIKYIKKC